MVQNNKILSKQQFYMLSWTWGALMSLIGAIVFGVVILIKLCQRKPLNIKKHGYCYYMTIGKSWGGVNLGMFFLTDPHEYESTKWHEHGHAIQNCFWGILMPFAIGIPSMIRYFYIGLMERINPAAASISYDAIWFEGDATATGKVYKEYFSIIIKKMQH